MTITTSTVGPDVRTRVAYDLLDLPIGPLLAAVTDRGVCRLSFDPDDRAWADGMDARCYPEALLHVRTQLAEYAAGERRDFDIELDLRGVTGPARRVLAETTKVAFGETITRRELAGAAGCSSDDVTRALGRNPIAVLIPCHRVTTGGPYVGGADRHAQLVELEAAWARSTPSASPN